MGNIGEENVSPETKPPQERSALAFTEHFETEDRMKSKSKPPRLEHQVTIPDGDASNLESFMAKDFTASKTTSRPEDASLALGKKRMSKGETYNQC